MEIYKNYFANRGIDQEYYRSFTLPAYISAYLPSKEKRVLDIGMVGCVK